MKRKGMKKKEQSLIKKEVLSIIVGILLFISALTALKDGSVFLTLRAVLMCIVLIITPFQLFGKYEKSDEMSDTHYAEADSITSKLTFLILMIITITTQILNLRDKTVQVNLYGISMAIAGFMNFCSGITFLILERLGD